MANQKVYWKILEERFGQLKRELPVTQRFEGYFNGIQGWQFPIETVRRANKKGQLLTMDIDFPGNRCLLDCVYCFAKAGEKTGTYYRQDKGDKPLTVEEVKDVLKEAKQLGLESAKVIGYREPFDNPGIHDFIDYAAGLGIHLVVFTAGYTLGEQEFNGDLIRAVDFLAERPVSLMVKLHTLDKEKEDEIVRREGYSISYIRITFSSNNFIFFFFI